MKKGLKILCAILALGIVFLLGWRGMPRVWPAIKENIVYPVLPQLQPTPEPTPEPYTPRSSAAFNDPISVSDSVIYYFYKDYCPWCRQLEPLTAAVGGIVDPGGAAMIDFFGEGDAGADGAAEPGVDEEEDVVAPVVAVVVLQQVAVGLSYGYGVGEVVASLHVGVPL